MKSECIELNTDRRNWIPDNLSDQWFVINGLLAASLETRGPARDTQAQLDS
jgi:hypothetical protein